MTIIRRHLTLLLFTALACTPADQPGKLTGTVTWHDQPIAMALVEAYPRPERDPNTPPVGETPSGEDGSFTLELPPGEYWVWARATMPGDSRELRLVGQAVPGLIRLQAGSSTRAEIALQDATGFASATGPAGTGVRGTVLGAPAEQITVYVYRGRAERPQGPGFAAAVPVDDAGAFQADLVPGVYTLAARWRTSGADHGSLRPGDRVAVSTVVVEPDAYTAAGTLTLRAVDPQVWRTVGNAGTVTNTWVAGKITDATGNPKAAIRVLVFDDPRMAGKPLALSPPSGDDGTFRVYLPGSGRFYLGARSRIGGPAEPGEWTGTYRGEGGDGVQMTEGSQLDGVEIQVEEVW